MEKTVTTKKNLEEIKARINDPKYIESAVYSIADDVSKKIIKKDKILTKNRSVK